MQFLFSYSRDYWRITFALFLALLIGSCGSTSGLINKVKSGDKVYENSCTSFQADVQKLLAANAAVEGLPIATYDNTSYDYFYLEPGQFEVRGDTLRFRLKEDLNYAQYVDNDIAIEVTVTFEAPGYLDGKMYPKAGKAGVIKVDRAYFVRHRRPLFFYELPLKGVPIAGRQLAVSFQIARYEGSTRAETLCETEMTPLGKIMPTCCEGDVWQSARPQSIAELPVLATQPDTFAYAGFRAAMDIYFQDNAYVVPDGLPATALQSILATLAEADFAPSRIIVTAFAGADGQSTLREAQAKRQADAVVAQLKTIAGAPEINQEVKPVDIAWIENTVQASKAFSNAEKDEVKSITQGSGGAGSKMAKFKLLGFYAKLNQEVLQRSNHVRMEVRFDYTGNKKPLSRYPGVGSLWDAALLSEVGKAFVVSAYSPGKDIPTNLQKLDKLLTQKASANLYTIRASYYVANQQFTEAVQDLEQARNLAEDKKVYDDAIRAYQLRFADSYDINLRLAKLAEYDKFVRNDPSNRTLFFQRAMLMEKCGLSQLAINEYNNLFEDARVNANQLNNRGVALLKAFHYREARIDFEQAISKEPNLAAPRYNLALVFAYLGYERDCLDNLRMAIDRDPRMKVLIKDNPAFAQVSRIEAFEKMMR